MPRLALNEQRERIGYMSQLERCHGPRHHVALLRDRRSGQVRRNLTRHGVRRPAEGALPSVDELLATAEFLAGMVAANTADLDEQVTVTLARREWMVIVSAARDYDVRVPREQGDGGACLDKIERILANEEQARL